MTEEAAMIQTKLRATIKNRDHLPGTWETPINPDGEEAADYIDNMVYHFGCVLRRALENIEDPAIRNEIEKHAMAAIKGEEDESGIVLAGAGRPLAPNVYRG